MTTTTTLLLIAVAVGVVMVARAIRKMFRIKREHDTFGES